MRFGHFVVLAILGVLGFSWLDSNVEWIHNQTPWGKKELAERVAQSQAREAFCSSIEPSRRYFRVVERTDVELNARDDEGDYVRMDVFRVVVRPLYQLSQDDWIATSAIGDKNSNFQRSSIELLEIEEKQAPQTADQQLLVRTACERLENMLHDLEMRQPLNDKDQMKYAALRDALVTPIMMRDPRRRTAALPITATSFAPITFPLLTPAEYSRQRRQQSR